VVLVGITAISVKDVFYTPYSRGRQADQRLPGVALQAHSVSQLLRAALDGHAMILAQRPAGPPALPWSVLGTASGLCIRALASGVAGSQRGAGARAGWLWCPAVRLVDSRGAPSARLGAVRAVRIALCLLSGTDATVCPDAVVRPVRLSRSR
jgi:hypothetical protein